MSFFPQREPLQKGHVTVGRNNQPIPIVAEVRHVKAAHRKGRGTATLGLTLQVLKCHSTVNVDF